MACTLKADFDAAVEVVEAASAGDGMVAAVAFGGHLGGRTAESYEVLADFFGTSLCELGVGWVVGVAVDMTVDFDVQVALLGYGGKAA